MTCASAAPAPASAPADQSGDSAQQLLRKAEALAREKKFPEAIDAARQAIALRPDWPYARKILATIYMQAGKAEDAFAQYVEVLRAAPGDTDARRGLAVIYYLQGHATQAIVELRKAVQDFAFSFQQVAELPETTWPAGPRPLQLHLDLSVPTAMCTPEA